MLSSNLPQHETALLAMNDIDILNAFPEEERDKLDAIEDEQFLEIANLTWEKMQEFLGDHFWEALSESIRDATNEVMEFEE